jgi:hypothetical protein
MYRRRRLRFAATNREYKEMPAGRTLSDGIYLLGDLLGTVFART